MSKTSWNLVCPGQGSQYPGMSRVLVENFPWTKDFFEEAGDAIKVNLLKLCHEGPEETLTLTHNAQPAILTTSFAWFHVFKKELDFKPRAAAGHSLGEYSALLSAGAMTLTEAAKLVRTRGELMQSAVPAGKGKMAAVLGLEDEKIKELCRESSSPDSLVAPVNFNSPGQVVIAGHAAAVDRAEILAKDPKYKARKVIPLKVSAPFHSPLMHPVVEKFKAPLNAVAWKPLQFPIAFNVSAELQKEVDVVSLLSQQIDHAVLWTDCTRTLAKDSPSLFVETGPGKVLTGLIKRIVDGAKCFSVDSMEEFRAFEKAYKEI